MAKVLQTTLQISEANVEQYCTADGLSLNTGGYAIRLYMNGHTRGSAILNNAAKEVLYPSATAHPFKIDSFIRANKSGGSMTISLQFDGTSVQSETGDWGSGLKNKIKEGISDPVVINSNRSTEIKWHIKGSSTVSRFSIASTRLTFYFNQYEMRPLVGNNANGIQKVTVSNASPCQGDTVIFTPKLVNGATWDGWYSDAACTNLVSADQNYSVSPSSDITLYAKATIDANLYNVSAVAGAEITGVSVSDNVVPEGSTATFTAQVNTGCSFEAWYSDDTYTTVVSTENPYTATITANTTLYAKAHRNSLNMSVGSAEHGTASVSATTVPYGSDATFTFTPEDETWELYGWYSDAGLTQLVSEANPYTFTATEDVTLYPKVGVKRYTITLKRNQYVGSGITHHLTIASLYEDQLTDTEREYIKTGEFSKIDQAKIFDITTVDGNDMISAITATLKVPKNLLCVLYSKISGLVGDAAYYLTGFALNKDPGFGTNNMQDKVTDPSVICPWNYYSFYPKASDTYYIIVGYTCDCSAIAKDGVAKTTVPTHVMQYTKAPFSAELSPGYTFAGWYSDEACTQLVSTDNPAQITCPAYTTEDPSSTSLTLYAKATKIIYTIGVGTAEHGSASVSTTTAYYGDTITFNCTVDEGYEFNGWYSDEELNQLVSESNPYTHSVEGNTVLYPKVGKKIYTITLQWESNKSEDDAAMAIIDFNSLTEQEISYLKTGEYEKIDQNKVYEYIKKNGEFSLVGSNTVTLTMRCPFDMQIAMCLPVHNSSDSNAKRYGYIENYTWWPYYWYQPTENATFIGVREHNNSQDLGGCVCTAIAKEGVKSVDATSPTVGSKPAIFTATMKPGYKFLGWYSDPACISRVSTENPASVITPKGEVVNAYVQESSLTLYAKAVPLTSTTGLSFKLNGTWKNALAVFKKTNGVWVQQSDPASLFTGSPSGTESNYLYLGE